MEAAIQVNYKHVASIRLWRSKCEDEGVRLICKFLCLAKSVQVLEILDGNINKVGCEIIGKSLHFSNNLNLLVLKLDNNPFGSEGLKYLVEGIFQNK